MSFFELAGLIIGAVIFVLPLFYFDHMNNDNDDVSMGILWVIGISVFTVLLMMLFGMV